MATDRYDHEPCRDACGGKGANLAGGCSDCLGTGHPHAPMTSEPRSAEPGCEQKEQA